jgi:hypothetical protein
LALRDIGYRNEKLTDILHSYVVKQRERLNVFFLAMVISSYSALFPAKLRYFNDLAPELHDKLAAAIRPELL